MPGMSRLRVLAAIAGLVARAWHLGPPRPMSTGERLGNIVGAGAPVAAPVTIHWDRHQIPSIEAGDERDLAVGLGIVHAHLRLAQMEAMRRLATGTVAEIAGPVAVELDRALRLIGFASTATAIEAMLPAPTRSWAEGFTAGVNHHIAHAPTLPHEFSLLGFAPRPWTVADMIAVGRLASTDVSWLLFARLLRARSGLPPAEWDRLWPSLQQGDTLPLPRSMHEAALGLIRGSNSCVVPAAKSAHGAGLIASDPHLPIMLPPLWLVAALHAPGFDAVGLMLPGLPFIAPGRNRHLAWGGTSLHAASSDLVDVSGEPMTERVETIQVRGASPVALRLRATRFGPVVSDGILMPSERPLSLRWVGQRPSDEMTAMLQAQRAVSFEAFHAAYRGHGVPGLTMLAVEAGPHGRAGRLIANHLPRRERATMAALVQSPEGMWGLDDLVPGTDNSSVGHDVLVSANDRPGPTPVPVGFFFSLPNRARRMQSLLEAPVTLDAMLTLQRDVMQPEALRLRDALLGRCRPPASRQEQAFSALATWDGSYAPDSTGALVFEVMVSGLIRRMVPAGTLQVLTCIWTGRALLTERIVDASPSDVRTALRRAARLLRRYGNWGGVHRLTLQHPLAHLPLVGRRYATTARPVGGSNDTLDNTAHDLVVGRHPVSFGSCARHVSDLADPDANKFVLLGGQDGWVGSANATDQAALWHEGGYVTVPLTAAASRAWPHQSELRPGASAA